MFRKVMSIFSVLLVAMSLCACQLARPDGLEVEKDDRLVGLYITRTSLGLYDSGRWWQSQFPGAEDGTGEANKPERKSYAEQIVYTEDDPYNGRIYAVPKKNEYGEIEYTFEGLDGVPFYIYCVNPDNDLSESWKSCFDRAIVDSEWISGENKRTIEGTLYLAWENSGRMYAPSVNLVFQSGDGRVYLREYTGGADAPGSSTLTEKYTSTENGKTQEEIFQVTLNLRDKMPPASIKLIQMSNENIQISSEEYTTLTLPESITFQSDTAYVIIETLTPSFSGLKLNREAYGHEETYFTVYKERGRDETVEFQANILDPVNVHLLWESENKH